MPVAPGIPVASFLRKLPPGVNNIDRRHRLGVLDQDHDVVLMRDKLLCARSPAAPAREFRIGELGHLIVDMEPHIDGSGRVVLGDVRLNGFKVCKVAVRAGNNLHAARRALTFSARIAAHS